MVTQPVDDVVTLLRRDHEQVKEQLSALGAADADAREELFWKLTEQLVRHEVAEEVVVYPALRAVPGGAAVADRRIAEQAEAEQQLARLEKEDVRSAEFVAGLATLEQAVLAHAGREEEEALPLLARSAPSTLLLELGERYTAAKLSAPSHPHPRLPDTPPGNRVAGPIAALVDRIRDAASSV